MRGIQRMFEVCHLTVMRWLGENRALPGFSATLLPGQSGDVLELDEL